MLRSAPALINMRTHSWWPFPAARTSGGGIHSADGSSSADGRIKVWLRVARHVHVQVGSGFDQHSHALEVAVFRCDHQRCGALRRASHTYDRAGLDQATHRIGIVLGGRSVESGETLLAPGLERLTGRQQVGERLHVATEARSNEAH